MKGCAKSVAFLIFCGCAPYTGKMAGLGLGGALPNSDYYWGRSAVQLGLGGGAYAGGYGGSGWIQIYEYHSEGTENSKLRFVAIDLLAGGAVEVELLKGVTERRVIASGGLGLGLTTPTYAMCASERAVLEGLGLVNPRMVFEPAALFVLSGDISIEVGKTLVGMHCRHVRGESKSALKDDIGTVDLGDSNIGGFAIGVHGRHVF